jgi:hypothetical protein
MLRFFCIGLYLLTGLSFLSAAEPDETRPEPLRQVIAQALETLKANEKKLPERFTAPPANRLDAFSRDLVTLQKEVGLAQYELGQCLDELQSRTAERKQAPLSLQAQADFVMARLQMRIAALGEYNYMLGRMRKELLPERNADTEAWQLTMSERITDRESVKYAHQARKTLKRLSVEQVGTPWELIARRELLALTFLGLQWEPVSK